MKTGYRVIDAMTRKPICINQDTDLKKCAQIMAEKHIGSLIVTDEKCNLIGFLSEQDIVRRVVARGINPIGVKAKEIMQKKIITITPEKDIYDALVKMRNNDIRHLPVIEGKKLLGLLTVKDVLKIQPQLFDFVVEKYHLREETKKPVGAKAKAGNCDECGEFFEELNIIKGNLLCDKCSRKEKHDLKEDIDDVEEEEE